MGKYSVLILPVIFFWAGLNLHLAKYGNDPNYVYLVNSAAICNGKTVGYIDHPGTPVMQVGALTILVKHSFYNPENESLTTHFLKDPHIFLVSIRNVLLFLNAIILFSLGWLGLKKSGSVWVGLLLQASTLITANTLDHIWTKVSPEPFLFFITGIFVIAILYYYSTENKNSIKYVLAFSFISGAGLATKATFLPLTVFAFIVLPTFKKKFIYLAGILPAFVLFTIPIIPEYEDMYYWFRDLTSHSGIYGHGEKGFIDFSTYFPNILQIAFNNPVFSAVLIAATVLLLVRFIKVKFRTKSLTWNDQFLAGLVASSIFGVLMVAKHYHVNHYLIPELLLTGITVFFIVKTLSLKAKMEFFTFSVLAVGFIVYVFFKQPSRIEYIDNGYQITNEEMDSTHAMVKNDFADFTKIYYYPNSLNIYSALNFGDVYTKRRMLPEIKSVHGDIYFYHSIENVIKNWNTEVYLEDLLKKHGNKIILIGGPRDEAEVQKMWNTGFPLTEVYKGRLQAIYTLDSVAYKSIISNKSVNEEFVECDFESLSADVKQFLFSNGQKTGNSNLRSDDEARSGKYSIVLKESVEFAHEYKIHEVNAGDEFEITTWRKPADITGLLVAAAEDSRFYYKSQNEVVQKDENGWGLLKMKIEIPPEMDGKLLKIYLWNKEKETIYFDDFVISKKTK